jgi:hypothetical protein
VDTVNACTILTAGDPGYFGAGGTGTATNQNVLWGDYFYVNSGQNFAQGETLVHIEAAPGNGLASTGTYGPNPETSVPGQYTFYGRYVGWTAADNREPLTTKFATRFLNGGVFNGGTSLVVWRDSKTDQDAFTCPAAAGSRPPWYPLGQEQIVIFDEQENPNVPPSIPIGPVPSSGAITPFPAEANRTKVGAANFPVPFTFGWLYLNLNTSITGNPNPPEDPAAAQAWVSVFHDASGTFSVGYQAIQLDSATSVTHTLVGN